MYGYMLPSKVREQQLGLQPNSEPDMSVSHSAVYTGTCGLQRHITFYHCYAEIAVSSPVVAETIASIHCTLYTNEEMYGKAE